MAPEASGEALLKAARWPESADPVLVIGHPNATVADGMDRCGLKLVPFDGPHVREVLAGASDFVPETIPAGTYREQDRDLSSFAVYATVVTHADTPDAEVTALAVRVEVTDPAQVDETGLRETGAFGVVRSGRIVQVIVGPEADNLAAELEGLR